VFDTNNISAINILKTLLRSPVKTLLTLLLMTTASFAVFSRVTEYSVTNRELGKLTSRYRGVAAIDTGVTNVGVINAGYMGLSFMPHSAEHGDSRNPSRKPPPAITKEQIEALSDIQGVSGIDIRYMTGGTIENVKRVARAEGLYWLSYHYTDRFVVEGTVCDVIIDETSGLSGTVFIVLENYKQLAGALP